MAHYTYTIRLAPFVNDISSAELAAKLQQSEATSYWLKDALKIAKKRDPVDMLKDAELLVALLAKQIDNLQP